MTNYAKINLGFELSEENYIADYATIYNKATAFISAQPEGSSRSIKARVNSDGSFVILQLEIVVDNIDQAKTKRSQVVAALPTLPSLIVDENGKGWLFNYIENGIIIE